MKRTRNTVSQGYLKSISLLLAVFFVVPALGQDLDFSDFDVDEDGYIERYEFSQTFKRYYWDDWNNKDNEYLDDEDFYVFNYALIDTDNDEMLTEDEWLYGYNYYYGDYVVDDFLVYDINKDGYVDFEEYQDALYDTDFYVVYDVDRDTHLSEDELADQVFENWDLNDNMLLSRSEFNNFDLYYSDI